MKSLRVALDEAAAMLVDTPNEIIRHADINRATRPARKDVKIILPHECKICLSGMAGTSPAMTN